MSEDDQAPRGAFPDDGHQPRELAPGGAGRVVAVATNPAHTFTKDVVPRITLLAGLGVAGDAHCGRTVQHRSRVAQEPTQPNLRQVHLLPEELFAELARSGFKVRPGQIGENITTRGLPLLSLPTDTLLTFGSGAAVRLTGLRNPCAQLDTFADGLMSALVHRRPNGELVRKAGVMGVVEQGGDVSPGDPIHVELPPLPHRALERV